MIGGVKRKKVVCFVAEENQINNSDVKTIPLLDIKWLARMLDIFTKWLQRMWCRRAAFNSSNDIQHLFWVSCRKVNISTPVKVVRIKIIYSNNFYLYVLVQWSSYINFGYFNKSHTLIKINQIITFMWLDFYSF